MSRARNYIRDSQGRFAPTPGKRVTSALDEAQAALDRAEQGIREIGEARSAQARRTKKLVHRHAVAGAALGALVPAPSAVKATTIGAAAFATSTTAAGAKIGASVGRRRATPRSTAGRRVR